LTARLQELRAAAIVTIQQALWGSKELLARMCLLAWLACSRGRVWRRAAMHVATGMHQHSLLATAWRCWVLHSRWRSHLQLLQARMVLRCAFRRWVAEVQAAQSVDAGLCHRAVQLPRVFAAWRSHTKETARLLLLGEQCRRLLTCRLSQRALAAWRCRAAANRASRVRLAQADAAWAGSLKRLVLVSWGRVARRKAAHRELLRQAAGHMASRCVGSCFLAWKSNSTHWQMAVQYHAARPLQVVLQAWRQHHQQECCRMAVLEEVSRLPAAALLRACFCSWAAPWLAVAANRQRLLERLAVSHRKTCLMRHTIASWQELLIGRTGEHWHSLHAASCESRRTALQQLAFGGWQGWVQLEVRKRQRLDAAAAFLTAARLRRQLGWWRQWRDDIVCRRVQVGLRWVGKVQRGGRSDWGLCVSFFE
jgi:hypothetical protein